MVEENTVRRVHAVRLACELSSFMGTRVLALSLRLMISRYTSLTVVLDDPEAVELGDTVRRTRVERSRLGLRGLDDLAIQLRSRGLPKRPVVSSPSLDRSSG